MKTIGILVALLLTATLALADMPEEVNGFRGLQWGAEISQLKGFKKVGRDASYGGIDLYSRAGDELNIGDAKLESISYGFWKGRLCAVTIKAKDYSNFSSLLDASKSKFGAPFKANRYIEQYYWNNDSTVILFTYSEIKNETSLFMASKAIAEEQKQYKEEKAIEAASKGF